MKKIALATTLTAGVLALSACSDAQGDDEASKELVVESKNGNITKDEFYQELKDRYGKQVLHEMVVTEVLDDKYKVTDKEIEKEVEKYKEQVGGEFDQALSQMGFKSEEDFRKVVEQSLMQQKAAKAEIKVSDEEIQNYYDRMKTEIRASHILVSSEEKAKEVKQKIEEGNKDFAALAKEYSEGPSASNGGDLDFFGPGKMTPAFEDAAYDLEKGEVSEPVKTEFGWHIIKLTDERENEDVKPLEDMKEQIKEDLQAKQLNQENAKKTIDKLIEEADVNIKAEGLEDILDNTKEKEASEDTESDSDEK
ncbi:MULTISPECIES: peptidylprolyl isomerase [Pontibacillus]|uniref:Foldase protein PrsA n=1 Tax=Pontibacillus chungwhensis TaxID=265426 RepID=A0ABY8UZK4_9BACI|nr:MULTISPECIES: peptidylprolyl isomerase [Pontibacillus]MCD5324956.1 peptidylprolyl isomerase [Pontibacillus sp. HN14]WIF98914.1 peptidylprolyl isomerase [Pontibacillus chungwhensis]